MPTPTELETAEQFVRHLADRIDMNYRVGPDDVALANEFVQQAIHAVLEEVDNEALAQYRQSLGPLDCTNAQKLQIAAGSLCAALDVVKARHSSTKKGETNT